MKTTMSGNKMFVAKSRCGCRIVDKNCGGGDQDLAGDDRKALTGLNGTSKKGRKGNMRVMSLDVAIGSHFDA